MSYLKITLSGPSSRSSRSGCCVALFSSPRPRRKKPIKSNENGRLVRRNVSISVHSFATKIVLQHDTDPLPPWLRLFDIGSQSTKKTSTLSQQTRITWISTATCHHTPQIILTRRPPDSTTYTYT